MTQKRLFLIMLILSVSITFTTSQANESMLFPPDIHSTSPSPTPLSGSIQLESSPMGTSLLATTSFNSQHIPINTQSQAIFVLQPSSNPIRSLSSLSHSTSILPSRSSSKIRPLFSTSMSVQAETTTEGFEITLLGTLLASLVLSPTPPPVVTSSTSFNMTSLSSPDVTPLSIFTFSPVDTSTSQSFHLEATTTVHGTSLDSIPTPSTSPTNSIMKGSLSFNGTTVRMLTETNIVQSTSVTLATVSSLSPTIMATTSAPVSIVTVTTISQTTTVDIINESTKELEESITRSTSVPGITTPAVIGMVVAACLALIATALLILVLCYCFCRSRKYEYRTGNEYRVTVQKWNTHYAHYTANQCDSVSSSRGSSIMSSFGFRSSNGKMKPRYGGVSSSADHVHTAANAEMYSTPL